MSRPTPRYVAVAIAAAPFGFVGLLIGLKSRGQGHEQLGTAFGLITAAIGIGLLFLPWKTWSRTALLIPAVSFLGVLVVGERLLGFSNMGIPHSSYPLLLIGFLAWVGATQPRLTALSFALCAGAALAYVSMHSGGAAVSLSMLALVVPIGVAAAEGASSAAARLDEAWNQDARRVEDLGVLGVALDELSEGRALSDVVDLLAEGSRSIFRSRTSSVVLIDADETRVRGSAGWPDGAVDLKSHKLLGSALAVDQPPGFVHSDSTDQLLIPLRSGRNVVGAVVVGGPSLGADDGAFALSIANLFSRQAGSAIEQYQRIESLNRDVNRDVLTGCGNRRHATSLIDGMTPGDALVLIDVDHFKGVNDSGGHAAGDRLLRDLATYLQSYLRGGDDLARYGGDEFVIILRDSGNDAYLAASRLLAGWQALHPSVTISLGLAVHGRGDIPPETLNRADEALYGAKQNGRNRVLVAGNPAIRD